jgi:hypothetical protein
LRAAKSRYVNKRNRNVAGVYSQSTRWRRGVPPLLRASFNDAAVEDMATIAGLLLDETG